MGVYSQSVRLGAKPLEDHDQRYTIFYFCKLNPCSHKAWPLSILRIAHVTRYCKLFLAHYLHVFFQYRLSKVGFVYLTYLMLQRQFSHLNGRSLRLFYFLCLASPRLLLRLGPRYEYIASAKTGNENTISISSSIVASRVRYRGNVQFIEPLSRNASRITWLPSHCLITAAAFRNPGTLLSRHTVTIDRFRIDGWINAHGHNSLVHFTNNFPEFFCCYVTTV
jgi:hypothetical protein